MGKFSLREGDPRRDPEPYQTILGLKPINALRVVTLTLQSDSGECTGLTLLNNVIGAMLAAQMLHEQSQRMTNKSRVGFNMKAEDD